MSKRLDIVKALNTLLNEKLDGVQSTSNIYGTSETKLKFFDEISNFPYLSVTTGDTIIEYQPGSFKWNYLTVMIRCYTNGEESIEELEQFFEDIETIFDENNNLEYQVNEEITSISILNITTSEGVMAPTEIGEMTVVVRYDTQAACL